MTYNPCMDPPLLLLSGNRPDCVLLEPKASVASQGSCHLSSLGLHIMYGFNGLSVSSTLAAIMPEGPDLSERGLSRFGGGYCISFQHIENTNSVALRARLLSSLDVSLLWTPWRLTLPPGMHACVCTGSALQAA